MTLFLMATAIVFIATGVCALVEASLYAVRRPYIHRLIDAGHPAGPLLKSFKEKMDHPITAVLIFDTLLGVGGAAIAGSQARTLYGEAFVYWFTLGLAVALLVFAQIIPKILGVAYNQQIVKFAAIPISIAIWMLYPVVRSIEFFTRHLKPDEPPKRAIEEDVKQMARISFEEGSILGIEADLIQNSLKLNDIQAAEIMTPLNKVVSFPGNMTVKGAFAAFHQLALSRIPVHQENASDQWIGLVLSRSILSEMANDHFEVRLSSIAIPIHFVDSETPGHKLLDAFLKRQSHLFGVKNKTGQIIGLVTLEDVMEEILGKEIVDEKGAGSHLE